MGRFLRQVADSTVDLFNGAFCGLDELALVIAPLVAAQQPMRDHVEVAPNRSDRPDRFAQLGKFILRERHSMVELLPDQGDNPTLCGLPRRLRKFADASNFMVPKSEPKLTALAASTG